MLQTTMYITSCNINYKLECALQTAMNITRLIIYYKLQSKLQAQNFFNLPHEILNRTTEITVGNLILNRFIKGYFQRSTYAALLRGTFKLIRFTLFC
jgi:hypothetical protein